MHCQPEKRRRPLGCELGRKSTRSREVARGNGLAKKHANTEQKGEQQKGEYQKGNQQKGEYQKGRKVIKKEVHYTVVEESDSDLGEQSDSYLSSYDSAKQSASDLPASIRPLANLMILIKPLFDLFGVILILVAVLTIEL